MVPDPAVQTIGCWSILIKYRLSLLGFLATPTWLARISAREQIRERPQKITIDAISHDTGRLISGRQDNSFRGKGMEIPNDIALQISRRFSQLILSSGESLLHQKQNEHETPFLCDHGNFPPQI